MQVGAIRSRLGPRTVRPRRARSSSRSRTNSSRPRCVRWATRGRRRTRDIGEVTTERRLTAEQLGGELADSLLVGPTGDLYNQARSAAIAKGRGVRLWLSLGKAPGLLSVPWEFLYLQPTFLASQRKTPIVRFLSTHAPVAPRRIEDTVRILGVVASPDGLPKLEVAQDASASTMRSARRARIAR